MNALTTPWCPHCRAHHGAPPPWCPLRNAMSVGADPTVPVTPADVKNAQTNGILLGLAVGVAGAALYYYAAKTAR